MSEPALSVAPTRRLRVIVFAADAARRTQLRNVILGAGHEPVDAPDAADVVIADGECRAPEGCPVVSLGGSDAECAGLLARDATAHQIDSALRAAAAGLVVRSASNAPAGFRAMNEAPLQTLLTPREIDVLSAIGEGLTNKAIARRLNISLHTVKFHVESLFRKLGARTRSEAVAKATERLRNDAIEL